jgi:hypothetical protein
MLDKILNHNTQGWTFDVDFTRLVAALLCRQQSYVVYASVSARVSVSVSIYFTGMTFSVCAEKSGNLLDMRGYRVIIRIHTHLANK